MYRVGSSGISRNGRTTSCFELVLFKRICSILFKSFLLRYFEFGESAISNSFCFPYPKLPEIWLHFVSTKSIPSDWFIFCYTIALIFTRYKRTCSFPDPRYYCNFPTKGLHSKRRSSADIFQVVVYVRHTAAYYSTIVK
jgi:hypothetical protein